MGSCSPTTSSTAGGHFRCYVQTGLRGRGRWRSVWWWKVIIQHHPARIQLARHGREPGEDLELLAELRRLNLGVAPLAMKIVDESVTVTPEEQYAFAERLVAMGRRFEERAQRTASG